MVVPLYFSPASETLGTVPVERLFLYAILFCIAFLVVGEMTGFFESENQTSLLNKLFLGFLTSSLALTVLVLGVWFIEYEFVGRFTIFKIGLIVGLLTSLFLSSIENLEKGQALHVLALSPLDLQMRVKTYLGRQNKKLIWTDYKSEINLNNIVEFCKKKEVEILLLDKEESPAEEIDIVALLESGVRVMGVASFLEMQSQKIPPSEVDRAWLAKLDLRLRDPLIRHFKRSIDLIVATCGIIFSSPIFFIACVLIVLESGFPLFFHQKRTGLLGRPYVLYKLRTMNKNAESQGAEWARKDDIRVTRIGRFLRKWRIDEIPQFWNVIKGEMSIVGPRPERPELEEKINQHLPFWKCRYLLKPGLTGWAQIRFEYASDMESSEEKLSYDLYYVKNASFFLDMKIMLSTLRSLTRGSR